MLNSNYESVLGAQNLSETLCVFSLIFGLTSRFPFSLKSGAAFGPRRAALKMTRRAARRGAAFSPRRAVAERLLLLQSY